MLGYCWLILGIPIQTSYVEGLWHQNWAYTRPPHSFSDVVRKMAKVLRVWNLFYDHSKIWRFLGRTWHHWLKPCHRHTDPEKLVWSIKNVRTRSTWVYLRILKFFIENMPTNQWNQVHYANSIYISCIVTIVTKDWLGMRIFKSRGQRWSQTNVNCEAFGGRVAH